MHSMTGVTFRQLGRSDIKQLRELRELYGEVFRTEISTIDDDYLEALLASQLTLFFVAQSGEAIVGGITAHLLPSVYGNYKELYLYDVAIATAFQRQGVGSGLLNYIKEYCQTKHIKSLFVQADAEDLHARRFYAKNGGQEADVWHYDFTIDS